jgi:molybdopterin/thiamine biosynthesis adenylyltransferase
MSPKTEPHTHKFQEIQLTAGNLADLWPLAPRSARLPGFIGAKAAVDAALDNLRVLIVGAGSVGGVIARHLACLQIREIRLVDPGQFKRESILTHLVDPTATGSKAVYWGGLCKSISPTTRVYAYVGPVENLGAAQFDATDIVVMATDNLAAEVNVGQRCIYFCKPLLQASVYGDALVAQVRFWQNSNGSGPCPRCAFGADEEMHMYRHTQFRCGGDGLAAPERDVPPTMSVSPLCSLAADLAMMQLLRWVLKLGAPLEDGIVEYCGYTHKTTVGPLRRRAGCECEHVVLEPISVKRPLNTYSLKELTEIALTTIGKEIIAVSSEGSRFSEKRGNSQADLSFAVGDDLLFVEGATCCGNLQPARQFFHPDDTVATCVRCGAALRAQTYYSHRPVASGALGALLDLPLGQLGALAPECVLVRGNNWAVLCKEEENGK